MKNRLFLFFLMSFFSLTTWGQQKPRVAVYVAGEEPVSEIVTNRLIKHLGNIGFTPLERSSDFLMAVSKEHAHERSGMVDDATIAALGQQFGAQYVCVVSIVDVWHNEKYISGHVIDANSAEVIGSFNTSNSLSSPTELADALDMLCPQMTLALSNARSNGDATKLAVYVVESGNKDVDYILGDQLMSGFSLSEKYLAVERTSDFLEQMKKESSYRQSGAVDNRQMAQIGKQIGVQYVCVVKVLFWEGSGYVSARLINVETSETPKAYNVENVKIANTNDVFDIASQIVAYLAGGSPEEEIYDLTGDVAPRFPGGEEALYKFLADNIHYPELARSNGITGKVVVAFVVEKDGRITNSQIVNDIGGGCGKEVLRVLAESPRWIPGQQNYKPVRSHFSLPVVFEFKN